LACHNFGWEKIGSQPISPCIRIGSEYLMESVKRAMLYLMEFVDLVAGSSRKRALHAIPAAQHLWVVASLGVLGYCCFL
jgi:hypothetical protein